MKNRSEVTTKLIEFEALYENQWGNFGVSGSRERDRVRVCEEESCRNLCQIGYYASSHNTISPATQWYCRPNEPHNYGKGAKHDSFQGSAYRMVGGSSKHCNVSDQSFNKLSKFIYHTVRIGLKCKPELDHLRVFGFQGFTNVDDIERTILDSNGFRCLFLEYAEGTKGYRVFDLENFPFGLTSVK